MWPAFLGSAGDDEKKRKKEKEDMGGTGFGNSFWGRIAETAVGEEGWRSSESERERESNLLAFRGGKVVVE